MATVLITGANRGVGLELTRCFAANGDTVLACCRKPEAASDLQSVRGSVEIFPLDVADASKVNALVASLGGRAIDVLVNNAGILGPDYADQTAFEMDFEGFAETLNVNTIAPVRMMQSLLPNLRASGSARVINITSQMGAIGLDVTMAFAYCSSKAALNKFMKLAAIELGKENIYVGLIHPGWVQTEMGGADADITPQESAAGIFSTIGLLNEQTNGSFWKWDGETHA